MRAIIAAKIVCKADFGTLSSVFHFLYDGVERTMLLIGESGWSKLMVYGGGCFVLNSPIFSTFFGNF